MKWLLITGFVIAGIGFALLVVSGVPMQQLEEVAHVYVAKVPDGRGSAIRVLPREPYEVNVDRMIALLPFCPSVKEVDLPAIPNLRQRLETLSTNTQIISFRLLSGKLDNNDVLILGKMKQLQSLELSFSPRITDDGISQLAECTKLRVLTLERTGVAGTGLAKLAGCKDLERLRLADCPVTDESVVLIPRFPKMKNMSLAETQITAKGLMHFVTWHRLHGLGIPKEISREARVEFNRQWLEAYHRARAAGEDLPEKARPPVYVRD